MITHVDSIEDAAQIIYDLKETIKERDERIEFLDSRIDEVQIEMSDLVSEIKFLQKELADRDDTIERDNAAFNNILDEAKGRL
jgi:chromosome segregation ATPase